MQIIKDKIYYSLNDLLKFEESPFLSHRERYSLEHNIKKQEDLNIPLLLLQISGADYETERVIEFLKEEFSKKDSFDVEKFDEIVKKKKFYEEAISQKELKKKGVPETEWSKYKEFKKVSFKSLNNIITELKKENLIDDRDVISFAGVDPNKEMMTLVESTRDAMKKGVKLIIQGQLLNEETNFRGIPDLLKYNGTTYDVYDIKRSNTPKAKFALQICAYSDLLEKELGKRPDKGYILLGNKEIEEFLLDDYYSYYKKSKEKFFKFQSDYVADVVPKPKKTDLRGLFKDEAKELLKDHLESVVNIDSTDLFLLKEQGIETKEEFLKAKDIKDLPLSVVNRIREQINIETPYKILQQYKDEPGNLYTLSPFQRNDAYIEVKMSETLDRKPFLCYYNILTYDSEGNENNKHFYCSREQDEERVFNMFMIYLLDNYIDKSEREYKGKLFCFDNSIYQILLETANKYASKMASIILNKMKYERFVYLKEYLVNSFVLNIEEYSPQMISECLGFVNEGLDLGFESSLVALTERKSIFDTTSSKEVLELLKKLAYAKITFYRDLHSWMVKQAKENKIYEIPEDNQVYFKKIKKDDSDFKKKVEERQERNAQREQELKEKMKSLNELNESKQELEIQETKEAKKELKSIEKNIKDTRKEVEKINKEEEKEIHYKAVVEKSKQYEFDNKTYNELETQEKIGYLLNNLTQFHKRENEFQRLERIKIHNLSLKELIDNTNCLTNLKKQDLTILNERGRDVAYLKCSYNEREVTKLKESSTIKVIKYDVNGTIKTMNEDFILLRFVLNEENESIVKNLKKFHITDSSIINFSSIINVIENSFIDFDEDESMLGMKSKAIHDLLLKKKPDVANKTALYDPEVDNILEKTIEAVLEMNNTCLIIQGPPGTGKSYTASKVIEAIFQNNPNAKIGISSNSNKAIDGLLLKVKESLETDFPDILVGKDCNSRSFPEDLENQGIVCSDSNKKIKGKTYGDILNESHSPFVIGSTVFRTFKLDLDYLFVDEAGQVPLANIIAMGMGAKNIILIGDQNQLEQPIIASHPGESGMSVLNYYLDINEDNKHLNNVVPPDKGFFLPISRRMNKELCKVVSKYFYKGQLKSIEDVEHDISVKLDLKGKYKDKGFQFIPVNHEGNSIYSPEEIVVIENIVTDLLECDIYENTKSRKITKDDIIIVAPFNVQVDKMKMSKVIGDMHIGTVDKFQGQEAPIVIYSQTASEIASSKGIDFILNPNRLNVALSRGKALAIMVGSENLLSANAEKMEDLRLLNIFSELIDYRKE